MAAPSEATVGGLTEILSNPAIATPSGFALAVLGYLGKLWLDGRKDKRADRGDRRTDESHIVEETKDILAVRREEMADFQRKAIEDRKYIGELETANRALRRENLTVMALQQENEELREILADRLGQRYVGNGSVSPSTSPRGFHGINPAQRRGHTGTSDHGQRSDLPSPGGGRRHRGDDG